MLKRFRIAFSILLLVTLVDRTANASSECDVNPFDLFDEECISWSGGNTVRKSVPGKDWGWSCNSLDILKIDVFNHSSKTIKKVVFTATKINRSWSELVNIYPNNSVQLQSGWDLDICKKGTDKGRLDLYYDETTPFVCEKRRILSKSQIKKFNEEKEIEYKSCIKNENEKRKSNIIYDNCVISKSKGALKSTLRNIRSSCRTISKDPTFFEKLKWSR